MVINRAATPAQNWLSLHRKDWDTAFRVVTGRLGGRVAVKDCRSLLRHVCSRGHRDTAGPGHTGILVMTHRASIADQRPLGRTDPTF